VVQVFRRMDSMYESARLKLHGLDAAVLYEVTDLDVGKPKTLSGQELLNRGLPVEIGQQPGSALIKYRKL